MAHRIARNTTACVLIAAQAAQADPEVAVIVPEGLGPAWQKTLAEALEAGITAQGGTVTFTAMTSYDPTETLSALQSAFADGAAMAIVPRVFSSEFDMMVYANVVAGQLPSAPQDVANEFTFGYGWTQPRPQDVEVVLSVPGNRDIMLPAAHANVFHFEQPSDDTRTMLAGLAQGPTLPARDFDDPLAWTLVPGSPGSPIRLVPTPELDDDDGCGCDGMAGALMTCDPDGWDFTPGEFGFADDGALYLGREEDDNGGCGICDSSAMGLERFLESDYAAQLAQNNQGEFDDYANRLLDFEANGNVVIVMACDPD